MQIDHFVRYATVLSLVSAVSSLGCSSSGPGAASGNDAGPGSNGNDAGPGSNGNDAGPGSNGNDAGPGNGNDAGPGSHDAGPTNTGACNAGAVLTKLPACTGAAASTANIAAGCTPTIDGAYHDGEWSDATCVTIGNDPVYVKYSGTTLYVAWSMTPVCGCPAQMAFNPEGTGATLDGKQFGLGIFDDPAANGGDSFDFTSQGGTWTTGTTVPAGIKIGNPAGSGSNTVTYEVAIPFAQIGLVAGQTTPLGFTLSHNMSGAWPASNTPGTTPSSTWGTLTSSADWK